MVGGAIASTAAVSIGASLRERGVVHPLQPTEATRAAAALAAAAAAAAAAEGAAAGAAARADLLRARVGGQGRGVLDVHHGRVVHGRAERVVGEGNAVRVAARGGHEDAEGLAHGAPLPLLHAAHARGAVVSARVSASVSARVRARARVQGWGEGEGWG